MKTLIIKPLILLIALLAGALHACAYVKIAIDPWVTAQVVANTSAQKLIEDKHNARLDSIRKKQEKIAQYTATMAGIKEMYQFTMQNVRGFGEESLFYKEIFQTACDILVDIPEVTKAIAKSPGKNYILCLNEMMDVTIEVEGLIHDFKTIVNNGKIRFPEGSIVKSKFPEGGGRFNNEKNDGYNYLDRYERINMANTIYTHLLEIKYKLDAMVMMCQYCGLGDVFYAIDPESWATYFAASNAVDGLINDWNAL